MAMFDASDISIRWSPWLVFLGVALYGALHSLLAASSVKAAASQQLGSLGARGYRLFYNIVGTVTLMPVLLLPAILPDQEIYQIPFPWVALTAMIQIAAAVGLLVGVMQTGVWEFLGLQQLAQATSPAQPALVVKGLYRYVRHPLYTAGLLLIWLIPVMTINLLALNIGLTCYILIGTVFEERKLVRTYGQAYQDYRERTPMLVPLPFRSRP